MDKNKRDKRIELLKKLYPLNEDRKIFDIDLHYPKASDILDNTLSTYDRPFVSKETIEHISSLLIDIPAGYKADISLIIDDYEGYRQEKLLSSLNDNLELNYFRYSDESKKKLLSVVLLLLFGAVALLVVNFGSINHWFGDEGSVQESILSEIVDITGWVFIWEAISLIFIERSDIVKTGLRFGTKINRIALYNETDEKELAGEGAYEIVKNWNGEPLGKRIGQWMLLFSGAGLIGLSFHSIFDFVSSLSNGYEGQYLVIEASIVALTVILMVLSGLSSIGEYTSKGKLRKALPFFVFISSFFLLANLIRTVMMNVETGIINVSFSFLVCAFYVLGYFLSRDYGKKK